MSFRVFTLVCLFIIRCRFPADKSVAVIIRERYGSNVLKDVRKLEKIDFKKRKVKLDINYLETCRDAKVYHDSFSFEQRMIPLGSRVRTIAVDRCYWTRKSERNKNV